jgi:CAAX protease family protein
MNKILENIWEIKSRYLLLFLFLALLITIVLTDIFVPDFFYENASPLSEIVFGYLFYLLLGYFLFTLGRKSKVSWINLFGEFSYDIISLKNIITVIALISIAFATLYLVFYPLSFYYPDFVNYMIIDSGLNLFWFSGANYKFANLLSFIEIVLLAPIIEEIFFRGFLFTSLALKYNISKAVIFSSLLFSLFHMDPLGSFIFGSVLCITYMHTKSLGPAMLIHIMNNFIAFIWTYINENNEKIDNYTLDQFQNEIWIGIIGFLIGSAWLVNFYFREIRSKDFNIPYLFNKKV